MGIIVKQLIFNTMLENNNKIVGNNQQTESEAKLVSNTLNPESMEDKDTLKRELEGNNMEINNLKNSTMKISLEELINELDLSATIKSLYEELKKAKETALSMAEEGMDVKMIARLVKVSEKDVQKWIDENFIDGAVTWEMDGANAIKVTDKTGDSIVVQLDEID